MTPGTSEAQAAAGFLAQHGSLFGGTFTDHEPEVRQLWSITAKDESFTSFAYRQLIRGKEVEGSDIRIKVKRGTIARVDYAAARIAGEPTAGSENPYLTAEAASLFVRVWSGIENLVVQGTPEEVVLRGEGQRPDAWCWRVHARIGENARAAYRTYFVDTAMPRMMLVQDNEFACAAPRSVDPPTTGTVKGYGLESHVLPYQGSASPQYLYPIPGIRVATLGGGDDTTFTDSSGSFSFSHDVSLTGLNTTFQVPGTWYFVTAGSIHEYMNASASATQGSHTDLTLANSFMTEEEQRISQVNAVVGAQRARDFFLQYIGTGFSRLDLPMELRPNVPTTTLNGCGQMSRNPVQLTMTLGASWGSSPDGMWNCASGSVTAHEFGHAALYILELSDEGNGPFNEGYGDVYASMVNDDNVFGREHHKDSATPIRGDPSLSPINCQ